MKKEEEGGTSTRSRNSSNSSVKKNIPSPSTPSKKRRKKRSRDVSTSPQSPSPPPLSSPTQEAPDENENNNNNNNYSSRNYNNNHNNNNEIGLPLPRPGAVSIRGMGNDGLGFMADNNNDNNNEVGTTTAGEENNQSSMPLVVAAELTDTIEEERDELKHELEFEREQRRRIEALVSNAVIVSGEPSSKCSSTKKCIFLVVFALVLLVSPTAIGVPLSKGKNDDPPTKTTTFENNPPTTSPAETQPPHPWSCPCKDITGSFLTLQTWEINDPNQLTTTTALNIFDELFGRDEWRLSQYGFQEHLGAALTTTTTTSNVVNNNNNNNAATDDTTTSTSSIMLMNIFQSNTSLEFVEDESIAFVTGKPSLSENMVLATEFLQCKIEFHISNTKCAISLSNIDEYNLRISHWKLLPNNNDNSNSTSTSNEFWNLISSSSFRGVGYHEYDDPDADADGIFGFHDVLVTEYFGCQQPGTHDVYFFSILWNGEEDDNMASRFANEEKSFLNDIWLDNHYIIEDVDSPSIGAIHFDHTCVTETSDYCIDNTCENDSDCAREDSVCIFSACAEGPGQVFPFCPCLDDSDCDSGICNSHVFRCETETTSSESADDGGSFALKLNFAISLFLFLSGLLTF